MNRRGLVILVALSGLAYASASGGCLRKWRAKREAARLEQIAQQEAEAVEGLGKAPLGQPLPTVGLTVVGDPGLEVAVWTSDDTSFAAARVLEPYVDRPVPIPQAEVDAWRARGIRFVTVPAEDVNLIAASSRPLTPVQRQRFGQLTSWSAVVRGPRIPEGTSGPAGPISAGKPRLIARAWLEPDLTTGDLREIVRVEVGLQIEAIGPNARWLGEEPGLRSIGSEGTIVDGLLVSFIAEGTDAIVLVGESPSVEWSELPPLLIEPDPSSEDPVGPSGTETESTTTEPERSTTRPGMGSLGPRAAVLRTVGERMLSAPGVASANGRPGFPPRKVFVVLIPRVPTPAESDQP